MNELSEKEVLLEKIQNLINQYKEVERKENAAKFKEQNKETTTVTRGELDFLFGMKFLHDNCYSDFVQICLWLQAKIIKKLEYVDSEIFVANKKLLEALEKKKIIEAKKTLSKNRFWVEEERNVNIDVDWLRNHIKELEIEKDDLKTQIKSFTVYNKDDEILDKNDLPKYKAWLKAKEADIDYEDSFNVINTEIRMKELENDCNAQLSEMKGFVLKMRGRSDESKDILS